MNVFINHASSFCKPMIPWLYTLSWYHRFIYISLSTHIPWILTDEIFFFNSAISFLYLLSIAASSKTSFLIALFLMRLALQANCQKKTLYTWWKRTFPFSGFECHFENPTFPGTIPAPGSTAFQSGGRILVKSILAHAPNHCLYIQVLCKQFYTVDVLYGSK